NKSFTRFSPSTRNENRDGIIRVGNIGKLNRRFYISITPAFIFFIFIIYFTFNNNEEGFYKVSIKFSHCTTCISIRNNTINKYKKISKIHTGRKIGENLVAKALLSIQPLF